MVSDVMSSQILDLRPAPSSARPAVDVAATDAERPATSGTSLPQRPAPEPADLSRVVENLNRFLENSQRNLNFRFDESSGRTIITVVNPETQEIVRQIPPEELLRLARTMRDAGMLFDALA